MLGLAELVGLAATVDRDGRSAVADSVAGVWGITAGAARFVRSSASHVFRVGDDYLRFVPMSWRDEAEVVAVAELMERCANGGLGVVQPFRSLRGRFVETVSTTRGLMLAMLVEGAAGQQVELAELGVARAHAWGTALALLHRDAVDPGLPDAYGELRPIEAGEDAELARAATLVSAELARLPRDGRVFGVTHGDFELDNLAWLGNAPTAYDFDEAALGWFVGDVVSALRDLRDAPVERSAFVAGYRAVRDLSDEDAAWAPLFRVAFDLAQFHRAQRALDMAPGPADPPWAHHLCGKLRDRSDRLRAAVLTSPVITG